jgi:thioredoxin 1
MQQISQATYQDEVILASHRTPVLVDFWGPRCGPCVRMTPWFEEFAVQQSPALKVVKVDSSASRHLCHELSILGLPTVVLYRDGQEILRLSGDACTPSAIQRSVLARVGELDKP